MALSLITNNTHNSGGTNARRVLTAPDGCTKYLEPVANAAFDLGEFADWCLEAGRRPQAAFAHLPTAPVRTPRQAA